MHLIIRFIPALLLTLLIGCAAQQKSDTTQAPADSKSAQTSATTTPNGATASPNGRIVKSKDGTIEGEIVGKIAPKSKFAKLQIGITPEEVEKLIGRPDATENHVTGKAFIPFHFGGDTHRLETFYKHEGQLTFSNTNNYVSPNALIRIEANPKATGISK